MLRVGQRLNHPALVKAVVKESPACYDMMVKCGVKFADQVRPQRSENHLCRKLRRRRYLRSYAQVAEGSRR